RNATRTIPIVMLAAADPAGIGLVASLARPGGNVTGTAFSVGAETSSKGLELLKEAVPKVRRVAVLTNPSNPSAAFAIKDMQAKAGSLGVQLQLLGTRGPNEFDGAFAAMTREHAGAVLVVTETMLASNRARLADLATRNKLPSMFAFREDVEAGGLMSYGASVEALSRRAGYFADRVLHGAKPADLPIEQPTKFELVINLKTAKALGLTIPPSLLLRADQVIE